MPLSKKPGSGSQVLLADRARLLDAEQEEQDVLLEQVMQLYIQARHAKFVGSAKNPVGQVFVHAAGLARGSMYGLVAGQLLLLPIVQSALQPSPSALLPSSHCSIPTFMPSRQVVAHRPAMFSEKPMVQF